MPVFILGPDEAALQSCIPAAIPSGFFRRTTSTDAEGPDVSSGPGLVIALGQRMVAAVTNDSGAGHMLALSQVPLVSLYSKANPQK